MFGPDAMALPPTVPPYTSHSSDFLSQSFGLPRAFIAAALQAVDATLQLLSKYRDEPDLSGAITVSGITRTCCGALVLKQLLRGW